MPRKSVEAVAIGLGLWAAGAIAVILLGELQAFSSSAPWAALVFTPPVVAVLTKANLRGLEPSSRAGAALRFSVWITAVQLPLDAALFLGVFRLGWPSLSQAAQESLVLALLIGYFWMLTVPWVVSARAAR